MSLNANTVLTSYLLYLITSYATSLRSAQLSVALYKQGKYSEASKNFHHALLHSKQATNHLEVADLLYKRGVCLSHLKKHSRAWSCFDKALSFSEVATR